MTAFSETISSWGSSLVMTAFSETISSWGSSLVMTAFSETISSCYLAMPDEIAPTANPFLSRDARITNP